MIRITQLRRKCIGCNACVEAAPHRWRISRRDGKCTLVGGQEKREVFTVLVHDSEWDENTMAAKNCPVKIIRLEKV